MSFVVVFFVTVIVVLFLTRTSRVHLLLWKVQDGLEERIADSVFNQYQKIVVPVFNQKHSFVVPVLFLGFLFLSSTRFGSPLFSRLMVIN